MFGFVPARVNRSTISNETPMPPEQEPPFGPDGGHPQDPARDVPVTAEASGKVAGRPLLSGRIDRGLPRKMRLRGVLFGLSAGGVLVFLGMWAAGHAGLGLRVLAGDVLLLVVILTLV